MTPIIQGFVNWDFTSINRLSQPSTLSSRSFLCEKTMLDWMYRPTPPALVEEGL